MLSKEMVANPLVVTLEGTDKVRPTETLNYVLQLRFCSLHAPICRMFSVDWLLRLQLHLKSGRRHSMQMPHDMSTLDLRRRWRTSPKRCAWPHRRCTTVPTRSKSWKKRFVKHVININKQKVSTVMRSRRSVMPMIPLLVSLRKRGFMPSGRSMRRPQRRPRLPARPMRCLRSMRRLVKVPHPRVVAQLRLVERHLLLYLHNHVNNLPYGLVARFAEMQKQIYDSAQSDAGSDAGSEAGDFSPERADELAALKKRSMEGAMADADQTRMENLMFEKAHTRAAKRIRRVQREVGAGFKELFKAAVAVYCATGSIWDTFARDVFVSLLCNTFAALPAWALLRQGKKRLATRIKSKPQEDEQIRKWNQQDLSTLGISGILVLFNILFTIVFIANVSDLDKNRWLLRTVSRSVLAWVVLPAVVALLWTVVAYGMQRSPDFAKRLLEQLRKQLEPPRQFTEIEKKFWNWASSFANPLRLNEESGRPYWVPAPPAPPLDFRSGRAPAPPPMPPPGPAPGAVAPGGWPGHAGPPAGPPAGPAFAPPAPPVVYPESGPAFESLTRLGTPELPQFWEWVTQLRSAAVAEAPPDNNIVGLPMEDPMRRPFTDSFRDRESYVTPDSPGFFGHPGFGGDGQDQFWDWAGDTSGFEEPAPSIPQPSPGFMAEDEFWTWATGLARVQSLEALEQDEETDNQFWDWVSSLGSGCRAWRRWRTLGGRCRTRRCPRHPWTSPWWTSRRRPCSTSTPRPTAAAPRAGRRGPRRWCPRCPRTSCRSSCRRRERGPRCCRHRGRRRWR
ncbi:unnamed protein product [Prorocentrum cordatum]|uniref:Uncharacterized protein n=1 Tax=Prorocentrum cordatum TaxID=2364126 RepID=A0ABN9WSS5_9DINO|nr:unnamed protein product [Polarella glacialis]